MRTREIFAWIIAGLVAGIWISQQFCTPKPPETTQQVSSSTKKEVDSSEHTNTINNFYITNKIPATPADFPAGPIDSGAVAIAYFSTYEYEMQNNDSDLQQKFKLRISRNAPISFEQIYRNLRPTSVTTTTIQPIQLQPARLKFYLGASLQFKDSALKLTPLAALQNKKDNIIFGGYNPFTKDAELGTLWKIKFRK